MLAVQEKKQGFPKFPKYFMMATVMIVTAYYRKVTSQPEIESHPMGLQV